MRPVRCSLAAAAMIVAVFSVNMGGLGLASASAVPTTLCTMAQETCEGANRLKAGTMLEETTTQFNLVNAISNIQCTGSTFTAETGAVSGEPLSASIPAKVAPAYTGCETEKKVKCTITSVNTPYSATIAWTKANTGTFTITNGGSGEPAIEVTCGMQIECRFKLEPKYEFKGGKPASFAITGEKPKTEGKTCPAMSEETVTYSVKAPNPVFVAHT